MIRRSRPLRKTGSIREFAAGDAFMVDRGIRIGLGGGYQDGAGSSAIQLSASRGAAWSREP